MTIKEINKGLRERKFSALELAKKYLSRIEKENKKINAFLTVAQDSALVRAKEIDGLIARKKEIPLLTGIPLAVKDNILVEGIPCTAGSKILENYIAPYDATVVKIIKENGGLILGKTNLDEFAMGASTENSAFGPVCNPYDLSLVAGGSSGGSAAAVAADFCSYAFGSDTGGSIRLPASFCGVVGLKPTYGAVSRYGLIAFASSLDQIGPITKTVEDAKIVFDAIKEKDGMDSTSLGIKTKIKNQKKKIEIKNLKIGLPKEYFVEGMNKGVEKTVKTAIKKYQEMGAQMIEVSLPHTDYALASYYIINPSEASSNLARYDGIKYGRAVKLETGNSNSGLIDVYLNNRGKGFGAEVRRRIMIGTYALSAGYYEAYYLKAQKMRTRIIKDFEKVFQKVDAIFCPVSPILPFKIGEKSADPLAMYLVDVYTVSANLAGLPALSLPCGKAGGLPVGLQIIGKHFEEETILQIGEYFESC